MGELGVREKRMIQAGVEGLMALLLIFTSFIKSVEVLGYQSKVSYPIMIGALLKITEIAGIGTLEGDDFTAFLFYTVVLTLIYALCVIMTIRAWKGKGKVIYIIGNSIVIFLVLFLQLMVSSFNNSYALGYSAYHVGMGYWIAFILAIAGLVLGILNIRHPWTGWTAGRSTGKSGVKRHISMPDEIPLAGAREDVSGSGERVGTAGTVKVKFHMKNSGDSGVDTEYFHRDEDDDLL